MSTTEEQVRALGRRWAEAELGGDADALAALAVDDFTLVGPLGFVLTKEQWLDRCRSGAFTTHTLDWEVATTRDYGEAAIAIGCLDQQAAYRGTPANGRFRATHVAVRRDGQWLLAGIHLSPVAEAGTGTGTGTS